VKGSGADIWNTADAFQFNYQSLNGNGMITARVVSQTPTDPWAKAGVMIRESLTPSSTYAFVDVTPSHGTAFERRTATGDQSVHTLGPLAAVPYWVRLTRNGNTFSAYASADGTTWTLIGQATISMAANVFVGLAVTSHHAGVLSTATFDHVVAPSSTIMGVTFDWASHLRMAPGSDNCRALGRMTTISMRCGVMEVDSTALRRKAARVSASRKSWATPTSITAAMCSAARQSQAHPQGQRRVTPGPQPRA